MTTTARVTVLLLARTTADCLHLSDYVPTSYTLVMDHVPDYTPADLAKWVADLVLDATATRTGRLWHMIEGRLPEDRSHITLSLGDLVIVNGFVMRLEDGPTGWSSLG